MRGPVGQRSVLSIPAFRNLWVGQLISQFGDMLYGLVFMWMVLEATNDAGAVGIVLAFGAAPYVLFSLYAGVLADRLDRRMLLIASDVASAALVLIFLAAILRDPAPAFWFICLISFLLATANVIAAPARAAITPRLVPEERLQEALSLNSTSQGMMPFIGGILSGIGLAAVMKVARTSAYAISFAVNALTFVISAIFMATLPRVIADRTDEPKSPVREAIEGIKFIFTHKTLAVAILLTISMNFFAAPFMPIYTLVARDVFGGSIATLAFLESGFFLGMIVGSLVAMAKNSTKPGIAFAVYLILAGLAIVPMGLIIDFWAFMALNFLCGVFIPLASIPINTYIQLQTEDAYRGRVNSAMGTMAAAIMPIGMAITGPLLHWLGLSGIFLFMGGGIAACALLGLASKSLRDATLPAGFDPTA